MFWFILCLSWLNRSFMMCVFYIFLRLGTICWQRHRRILIQFKRTNGTQITWRDILDEHFPWCFWKTDYLNKQFSPFLRSFPKKRFFSASFSLNNFFLGFSSVLSIEVQIVFYPFIYACAASCLFNFRKKRIFLW